MTYKRETERALRYRTSIGDDLRELTKSAIEDVFDCEKMLTDALARRGDNAGVPNGDVSDPTAGAALRLAGREEYVDDAGVLHPAEEDTWLETQADPIANAILEFRTELAEAAGHMRRAVKRLKVVTEAGSHLRGRESSVDDCVCCGVTVTGVGSDRVKAGLCPRCYTACQDINMPDRAAFIRARRAWLTLRDKLAETAEDVPPWARFWQSERAAG